MRVVIIFFAVAMLDDDCLILVLDLNDEAVISLAVKIGKKLIKNTNPGGALAPLAEPQDKRVSARKF